MMAQVSKVRKFGLEAKALELKGGGLGSRLIARSLSHEAGEHISHMAVNNFLNAVPAEVAHAKEAYADGLLSEIHDLKAKHDYLILETSVWAEKVKAEIDGGDRDLMDYRLALGELEKRLESKERFMAEMFVPNQSTKNDDLTHILSSVNAALASMPKDEHRVGIGLR